MGVTGLWRLIEPSGTLVPLQTLDNKVLAVDVSIWLHQAIKGFQNAQGGTLPNAHLLGIYHRICKLLFFGIKPVVIFDGGVPQLKQQTIFQRANKRTKALSDAETIRNKLVSALLKHTAISSILSDESKTSLTIKPVKEHAEDIYHLPPTNLETSISSEEDETSTSLDSSPTKHWDLHTIDEKSAQFKALPVDVRHDILTDLKETRKQSSWGRLHELPKQSDDFSGFQMKRLLKRYSVQVTLEEVEKEMGGRSLSLAELESLLKDQGVVINDDSVGKRIASDESKRYLLIKDLKKAMDEAKQQQEILKIIDEAESEEILDEVEAKETANDDNGQKKSDIEFENDLKLAIELSLQDAPSTSNQRKEIQKKKLHELSFLQDFERDDFLDSSESEEDCSVNTNVNKVLASAKNYMVEYSGLTPNEIAKIMNGKPTITLSDTKDSHMGTETFEDESQVVIENPCNKTMPPGITNSVEPTAISRIYNENTEVTVEPQTVTEIIHDEPILLDSNSLINSTEIVSDNTEAVLEPQNIDKIAEDEESDSSGDFVEVSDTKPKAENAFEIVVKPEDELEDDLFSDVFKRVEDTAKTNPKKPNLTKIRELINVEEKTVAVHAETELKNVTEEITRDVVESQPEKDVSPISREQLQEIQQELQLENAEMVKEQLTKERMANSLSEQIVLETQDLLRLFGIPYVVAPMEAEAQCAFLEIVNLTDGTITDDSDIWLFGGKTVYKNFFNQQKQVLEYRAEKIQEHYKLSREQMILLALLVGSDYTLGLQGIGPVTALEILGSFPSSLKQVQTAPNYRQLVSGLIDFRQWLNGKRTVGLGRQGLRSKLKNVSISDTFPNLDVVRAYLEPNVDLSKEPFSWGKPNIEGLIDYAKRKFGWSRDKSEGILKPVLKSIQPEVQKSIKHYFKTKHKIQGTDVENKMSKRVKKAVETIEKGVSEDDVDSKKKTAKRRTRKKKEEIPCELSSDEDVKVLRKSQKQTETKLNQIQKEVVKKLDAVKKVPTIATLHKKEVIPQKQKDKADAFKNKIKAIETFRKSKQGPGFVKSRKRQVRAPKAEAELSESSSD